MFKVLIIAAFVATGFQVSAKVLINCVDGARSMMVLKEDGELKGRLSDFAINLKSMHCGVIGGIDTIRCEQGKYFVVIFENSRTKKLSVQVNLKGDFYPDSGYLHTILCKPVPVKSKI